PTHHHPRAIHACPTRRSSDLSVVAIVFYGANLGHNAWPSLDDGYRYYAVLLVEDLSHAELLAQNALDLVRHYYFSTKVLFVDHRSEEHTSELQSRFDLVCRLR